MIYTCSACGRSYAVPEAFAGLICDCRLAVAHAPASTRPGSAFQVPSSTQGDGGRSQGDVASVSTGREPQKGSQRSPQGQGGAIAPIEVSEADKASGISLKQREAATAWMKESFYAKKGSAKSIGDEWRAIVAACKGYGMQTGEKWRDWVKSRWDSPGPAQDAAIRMLIKAGIVPDEEGQKKRPVNPISTAIMTALEADHDGNPKGMSLDDLIARAAPGATQTHIDDLVDAGLVYEPLPGRWRRNKEEAK